MRRAPRSVRPNGRLIKDLRMHFGLSQEDLADLAKISDRSVRACESFRPVALETIEQICIAFNRRFGLNLDRSEFVLQSSRTQHLPLAVELLDTLIASGSLKSLGNRWKQNSLWQCEIGTLSESLQIEHRFHALRASLSASERVVLRMGGNEEFAVCYWLGKRVPPIRRTERSLCVGFTALQLADDSIRAVWDYPASSFRDSLNSGPRDFTIEIRPGVVRRYRLTRLYSQVELSEMSSLSVRSIRRAENGGLMNLNSVKRLALVLGVPPVALYACTDTMARDTDMARKAQEYLDRIWNHDDYSVLDTHLTKNFRFHHDNGVATNPRETLERIRAFKKSFSDYDFRFDDTIDFGEFVVCKWNVSMTHSGPWLDMQATNRRVHVRGASWVHVVGDRFGDAWDFWDPKRVYAELQGVE